MTIKFFGIGYFLPLVIGVLLFFGLYYLLKNKSQKYQYYFLFGLLVFNLALHFLKLTFPPYSDNHIFRNRNIWFINICAVNILIFPFIYLFKNKALKDYMFYLGIFGGSIALIYPVEALADGGKNLFSLDIIRFYIAHYIVAFVPLLMVLLKLHTISYLRVIAVPFVLTAVLAIIMVQNVIQAEMGYLPYYGINEHAKVEDDNTRSDVLYTEEELFYLIKYPNFSLPWGPKGVPVLGDLFKIWTPKFLKTVPNTAFSGDYAQTEKYTPLLWAVPAIFIYFTVLPFGFSLIWEYDHVKADLTRLKLKLTNKKS